MLGQDPDAERGDELQDDRAGHVLDAMQHPERERAQHGTDDDAAGDCEQERRGDRANREATHCDRADRQPVDQERAGVVQQALAFEDRQDPAGRAQMPEHGGGRGGVGRRDDGAQHDRRRPRQFRHQCPSDDGDGGRREPNGEDDQAGHGEPVVAEVAGRRVVGSVEQDRRDEEGERQLGADGELRRARHEGEDGPAQREEDGIRRTDPARRGREQHGRDEEGDQLFQFGHVRRPPASHERTRDRSTGSQRPVTIRPPMAHVEPVVRCRRGATRARRRVLGYSVSRSVSVVPGSTSVAGSFDSGVGSPPFPFGSVPVASP